MSQTKKLVDAIDSFIKGSKADGTWSAIKASCIMAGWNNLNGALTPLVGTAPTNFNFVSTDYTRMTGLKGDGSTKYLDSNRNNNADPQDSKHISLYKQAGVSSSEGFIGIPTATAGGSWIVYASSQTFTRVNASTSVNPVFSYNVDSFYGANRGSSATIQIRGEGSTSQFSVSSSSPANAAIQIFGGPSAPRTQQRLAFYSIGESLDLALLDTRVSQLMTDINNAISFDADAQAYITAVETADGQALETAVKEAINDFVVGCKADGIWNAIKSSAILAGARTLAGALQPLVGTAPTNYNFVSGDYNRKTGLIGNGSTKYLDINRNNNADPQDNNHNAVYATNTPAGPLIGCELGGTVQGANLIGAGARSSRNAAVSSITSQIGFNGINRTGGSSYTSRVSSTNSTISFVSQSVVSNQLFIMRNSTFYGSSRLAFYSIGESLDLALLDTRVSNLMTSLGNAIP